MTHQVCAWNGSRFFTAPIKLNIGAGNVRFKAGYVTLDANPVHAPDIVATVPPIPLPDACCSEVYSSHFLEHLTDDQVCELVREAWRVLVPGGTFAAVVPYAFSHGAIQDPTHRSLWVPEKFQYFTPMFRYLGYGLEDRFAVRTLRLDRDENEAEVHAILTKQEV